MFGYVIESDSERTRARNTMVQLQYPELFEEFRQNLVAHVARLDTVGRNYTAFYIRVCVSFKPVVSSRVDYRIV